MPHRFDKVSIVGMAAKVSPADSAGWKLSLEQDDCGKIVARLKTDDIAAFFLGHAEPVSRCRRGRGDCHYSTSMDLMSVEFNLHVPQATIDWRPLDSNRPCTVSYFLRGFVFLPKQGGTETLKLGAFDLELSLVDDYATLTDRLKSTNSNAVTAAIVAHDMRLDRVSELDETLESATWLLSFAFGYLIRIVRVDISQENTRRRTVIRDAQFARRQFRAPLLLDQVSGGLKEYLEWCFPRFGKYEKPLRLRSIIRTNLLLNAETVVDVQALLAANMLEVLRFNFGMNILVPQNRASLENDHLCWPPGSAERAKRPKHPQMYFGEILGLLAGDFKISSWSQDEKRFVKFRNVITHEGEALGASIVEKFQNSMDVLHFCHLLLFAALDWDKCGGKYIPVNQDPNTQKKTTSGKSTSIAFGINLITFVR